MKALALVFSLSVCAYAGAIDARQDCQNALDAAKKAGLPISAADLKMPPPSKASQDLEALINRASASVGRGKANPSLIAYIEKIAASPTPRAQVADFSALNHFPRQAKMKALLRAYMTHVEDAIKAKNPAQVSTRFRNARKLVALSRTDDSLIALLAQVSAEGVYFATAKKAASAGGAVALAVLSLTDRFSRPSIARVLQVDFWQSLTLFSNPMAVMEKSPKSVTLPKDPASLQLITKQARSWTKAYVALKGCKTNTELAAKYKAIEPKLDRVSDGEGGFLVLGPEWAKRGLGTDKVDQARKDAIQALSKFRK